MRRMFLLLAAGLLSLIMAMGGTLAISSATAAPSGYTSPCYGSRGWTTGAENSLTMSSDLLTGFRAGRHATCDRLVFVLSDDDKIGYHAAYGKTIMPNGKRMQVDGPVDFNLVIRAWPKGWDTVTTKDDFAVKPGTVIYSSSNPKGLEVVKQIKSAGAFEGETAFAVGLRVKTEWRLFDDVVLADGSRLVIVEFDHD